MHYTCLVCKFNLEESAMSGVLQSESTLTDRYQTTIPEPIREVLHLEKRDKIRYVVQKDGQVVLFRANEEDPLLGELLSFLAKDIQNNPEHLQAVSPELVERARYLISEIDIDIDSLLDAEDE